MNRETQAQDNDFPEGTRVPLRIRLFGTLEVICEGQQTRHFTSNKGRALLAYLVTEARLLYRDHLSAMLWPDLALARARSNLSRELTNLRQLMPGYIVSDRETVAFEMALSHRVDARTFLQRARTLLSASEEAWDAAAAARTLDLYRADFLDGFSLAECPEFEEWLVVQRERLRQQALHMLDRLAQHTLRHGDFEASLRHVERTLALEPWREEAHRQAMLLAALQGRREQALRQYDVCRRVLAEALDVAPSEATLHLYRRILAGHVPAHVDDALLHPPAMPFVGRGEPYAWLLARWEASRGGEAGMTLVLGEAGIGKTRLVEEVLRYVVARGGTVLRGRCLEFGTPLPYQAIHQALDDYLMASAPGTVSIPTAVAAELVQMLPVVHRLMPAVEPSPPRSGAQARTYLFDSLAYLLRTIPHPVLFLDDLHWADADTLDLLNYLIRVPHRHTLWVVGTYRPEDVLLEHPLTHLRHGLSRDGLVHDYMLPALIVADIEHLTTELVGEAEAAPLAAYLLRHGGGNPFVLEEMLKALQDRGTLVRQGVGWEIRGDLPLDVLPEPVQDVVMRRIARLPAQARWALDYASVIAQPWDARLLAAVMGEPDDKIKVLLQTAGDHHLLRPAGDGDYDFLHDRIRETLYQRLPDHVDKLMHERVGQTLLEIASTAQGAAADALAVRIAHHFERSPAPHRAAPFLRRAAVAASRAYAHETAIDIYRRLLPLLSEEDRLPVVLELAELWEYVGRWEEAESLLQRVVSTTGEMSAEASKAWLRLAQIQDNQGHYRDSLESARQAESEARRAGPGADETLALAINRHAWALYRLSDVAEALSIAQAGLALAEALSYSRGITASLNLLGGIHNHQGRYGDGAAALERALAIYRSEGNRHQEAQMLSNLGYTAYQRGDYEAAMTYCQEALGIAREVRVRYQEMLCLTNLGGAEAALGHYSEAEIHLAQVLDCPESRGWFLLSEIYRHLAEVRLGQGDVDGALARIQQALSLAETAGARNYLASAWWVLGEVAAALPEAPLVEGRQCTPDACFGQALALYAALGMEGERVWTLWRWARCLVSLGERERATALTGEAQAAAIQLGLVLPAL